MPVGDPWHFTGLGRRAGLENKVRASRTGVVHRAFKAGVQKVDNKGMALGRGAWRERNNPGEERMQERTIRNWCGLLVLGLQGVAIRQARGIGSRDGPVAQCLLKCYRNPRG